MGEIKERILADAIAVTLEQRKTISVQRGIIAALCGLALLLISSRGGCRAYGSPRSFESLLELR